MKELVLDIINSYEHRVVTVENLINNAYEAAVDTDEGLSLAYNTAQKLRDDLRETLVRNCSLRRKDFDAFTSIVFNNIDKKKTDIENERKLVREILKTYLDKQKKLVTALKEQLTGFGQEGNDKASLELLLINIKESQKEEGEQTFSLLRDIQLRLNTFRKELADLNSNFQRILDRGELLKMEDLRQFRANLALERRKAERKERKDDIGRLLEQFNQERREINR